MRNCRASLAAALISAALFISPSPAFASFDTNLSYGMRTSNSGEHAVAQLQQFLVTLGLLRTDYITDYFGQLTRTAVKAFQLRQGITPASGYWGPLTRARANALSNSRSSTFSASPSSGLAPLTVRFSYDQDAPSTLDQYSIDYGDGQNAPAHIFLVEMVNRSSILIIPDHNYASAGSYTAQLLQTCSASPGAPCMPHSSVIGTATITVMAPNH